MRLTFIAFLLFSLTYSCLANVKIAFVTDASLHQQNSAILNGLRSVASELSFRYNKKFEISFMSASDAQAQAQMLSKCYFSGFYGAVLYPVSGDIALSEKISELSKMKFFTVLLGDKLSSKDVVSKVSTDDAVRLKMIENVIKRRAKSSTKIACYFKAEASQTLNLSDDGAKIAELLNGICSFENFKKIFAPKILEIKAFNFYSSYATSNAVEIMRRDSFGEVFFSPELLANMRPIEPNVYREFALCVGGLPMLEYYLASGQITDCIYDDYFGWGVYAARALIERKFADEKAEVKSGRVQLVAPMRVSSENYKVFVSDWRKWLK